MGTNQEHEGHAGTSTEFAAKLSLSLSLVVGQSEPLVVPSSKHVLPLRHQRDLPLGHHRQLHGPHDARPRLALWRTARMLRAHAHRRARAACASGAMGRLERSRGVAATSRL